MCMVNRRELKRTQKRLKGLTSGGVELTDEIIEKLADQAEKGYDLDQIRNGRRREPRTRGNEGES